MGLYTNIDAYDRHWWEAYEKRCEASREELKDVEPVDESKLNLEDFLARQCRTYEVKNHLELNSMDFEDVLHDKDLLTRKDIDMLNNGASRYQIKLNRAKEWKEYKRTLAAKTR